MTGAAPSGAFSRAPEQLRRFGGGSVALFGEMLTVGLVVAGLCLTLITALPALAAGVYHLDRHITARSDTLRDLLVAVWRAVRGGWLVGSAVALVTALLTLNVALGMQSLVPGGPLLAVVSIVLVAVVVVVACRAASLWRPDDSWPALLRQAWDLTASDIVGTGYIVASIGVCAVVIWMFLPMALLTPGMLAVAMLAARRRHVAAVAGG